MKTAEEWFAEKQLEPNNESRSYWEFSLEDIKQIQLDAFKAGMTEAAEICHNSIQPAAPYFKTLIEAARDRKDLSL